MHTEHTLRTLAHQLAQVLRAYSDSIAHWRQEPGNIGRYERAQANLALVQVLTAKTFPEGRVEWDDLLRVHEALKLVVLRRHVARAPNRAHREQLEEAAAALGAILGQHEDAVAALGRACIHRIGLRAGQAALALEDP